MPLGALLGESWAKLFREYGEGLKQFASVAFCTTSFVLVYDATQRYRRSAPALSGRLWVLVCVLADALPLLWMLDVHQHPQHSRLLSLYQLLWLGLASASAAAFQTASICCSCRRRREEHFLASSPRAAARFGRWQLVRVSLFLLAALQLQGLVAINAVGDLFPFRMEPDRQVEVLTKVQASRARVPSTAVRLEE